MLAIFHEFLETLASYAMYSFEFIGILVLIIAGIKGVKDYITKNPKVRLILAEGMALSLEFKLGSEIIRTVIVREMSELYFIAGLIILRASLTFLIHWEIDHEERKQEKIEQKSKQELEKKNENTNDR